MKIPKSWWEAREAKAKADKAILEAKIANVVQEKNERIAELGTTIRQYAERRQREAKPQNVHFPSRDLIQQLGKYADQFDAVMEDLKRRGYARESEVPGHWRIGTPEPPSIAFKKLFL